MCQRSCHGQLQDILLHSYLLNVYIINQQIVQYFAIEKNVLHLTLKSSDLIIVTQFRPVAGIKRRYFINSLWLFLLYLIIVTFRMIFF